MFENLDCEHINWGLLYIAHSQRILGASMCCPSVEIDIDVGIFRV